MKASITKLTNSHSHIARKLQNLETKLSNISEISLRAIGSISRNKLKKMKRPAKRVKLFIVSIAFKTFIRSLKSERFPVATGRAIVTLWRHLKGMKTFHLQFFEIIFLVAVTMLSLAE